MTIISFLYSFSLSLRCIKSSFGSYFCPFIVVFEKQNKDWEQNSEDPQCKHKILLYLSETAGFLRAEESPAF